MTRAQQLADVLPSDLGDAAATIARLYWPKLSQAERDALSRSFVVQAARQARERERHVAWLEYLKQVLGR